MKYIMQNHMEKLTVFLFGTALFGVMHTTLLYAAWLSDFFKFGISLFTAFAGGMTTILGRMFVEFLMKKFRHRKKNE